MAEGKWRDLPPVAIPVEVPRRLRQTLLRTIDNCDRAGYLHLLHDGGPGSHELNRGSIGHVVFAKLTNMAIEQGESKIPPEVGKDILNETLAENVELQVPVRERDSLRAMVFNFCEGNFFYPETIIAVEQELVLRLGRWTITGRPDRVEQPFRERIDVIDYKTTFAIETQEAIESDYQGYLYALLLAFGEIEGTGICLAPEAQEFGLRQEYPRFLREDGLALRGHVVTRQALLDFRLDLEAQLARIERNEESGLWQPTPGSHCVECPSPVECPIPRHLRPDSQLAIENVEQASKLADWYYLTGKRRAAVMRRLKAFANKFHHESIPIGDPEKGDLELRFERRDEYPKMDRADFLADVEGAVEYGTPIDIEKYAKKKTSTKFGVYKRREKEE